MYNIKIICYFAQEIDSVNIITSWKTCFFHQLSTHSAMLPQSFLGYMNVKCQSVFVRSSVDLGSHIHFRDGSEHMHKAHSGFGFQADARSWVESSGEIDAQ